MQKLEDIIANGELEGYRQQKPEGIGAKIDEEVATKTICIEDRVTMLYSPWVNEQGSYRAFAVCPRCDSCFEF